MIGALSQTVMFCVVTKAFRFLGYIVCICMYMDHVVLLAWCAYATVAASSCMLMYAHVHHIAPLCTTVLLSGCLHDPPCMPLFVACLRHLCKYIPDVHF